MKTLKQMMESSISAEKEEQLGKIRDVLFDKTAYDTSGKRLGTVADATIGKNMTIGKLILDDGSQYTKGRIAAVNDIVLIKPVKPQKPKQKRQSEQMNTHASEQPSEKTAETSAQNSRSVSRRYGDFSFLLGKTADKSIINFYGETMIRAGETVTLDVLRQAKISGKLIELCLHVK